jgi:sugar phosphate isomerase/epimerase
MNPISFMTANFVARQLDYNMTGDWGQGDTATQNYFRPLATYRERLGVLLAEIKPLGFSAIDLWGGHLNPLWATPDHIQIAKELIAANGFDIASLAGWWDTREELEGSCKIATGVGTTILGGGGSLLQTDRAFVVDRLRHYGLKYGYENHPEKTPEEILGKIGEGDEDCIGLAVDTGWFGTQSFDAADAMRQLKDRTFHVHLKDVKQAGEHVTCRFGDGVVPLRDCVDVLKAAGYTGGYSIEHEPEDHNPLAEIEESYALLKEWMT